MEKQQQQTDILHPMEALAQEIERRGVMVFDDVTSFPLYGEPYVSHQFVIALNHEGEVKAQYDTNPVEFLPHELAALYPDHLLMVAESSPDYRATLIVFSQRILQEIRYRSPHRFQLEYINRPHFRLNDSQYENIVQCINVLRSTCQLQVYNRESILVGMLDTLSQLVDAYRFPNGEPLEAMSAGRQLFSRFYDDIVKHYRESHEVQFYAKRYNLSAKYFSLLIRRETGVTAPEWIARYIIVQAKSLLRSNRYTIQQISEELGFTEQSAFSRFFHRNTGVSPTHFRQTQLSKQ